jgi:membrane-associated phospholipid phosphatase
MSAQARRRVRAIEPAAAGPPHLLFIAAELAILCLLLALAVIVRQHPGPLPGDARLEVGVQSALLGRGIVTTGLDGISTLNWPVPTAITMAVIVGIFLLLRRWLDAIVPPIAAGVSSVATFGLSKWVHRPRPLHHGVHPLQYITTTYGFPSGHVAYAVTVFGLFLFLTSQVRRPMHPALIWFIRIVLVALILLMPISRMVEAEHWPSDILAGALDGLFWLVLFSHIYLWARGRWPRLLARDER